MTESITEDGFLEIKNRFPLRIGIISDLHCGQINGLMPPFFHTRYGQVIEANPVQKLLWEEVLWLERKFDELGVQYIFNLGDNFGGRNYIGRGAYIFLENADQVTLAKESLMPLVKDRISYVWHGTDYHELRKGEGEMHEVLVNELRADGVEAHYVGDIALVELKDSKRLRRLLVTHESPTAIVYPATLQSREIQWILMQMGTGKLPKIDAVIRAHTHHWLHVDHDSIHQISVPCMCGLPIYKATKKYFAKLLPDIGAVVLLVDEEGRMHYLHFLMPAEEIQRIVRLSLTQFEVSKKRFDSVKELKGFK